MEFASYYQVWLRGVKLQDISLEPAIVQRRYLVVSQARIRLVR
jgi:hypothetical protein